MDFYHFLTPYLTYDIITPYLTYYYSQNSINTLTYIIIKSRNSIFRHLLHAFVQNKVNISEELNIVFKMQFSEWKADTLFKAELNHACN